VLTYTPITNKQLSIMTYQTTQLDKQGYPVKPGSINWNRTLAEDLYFANKFFQTKK